MGDVPDDSNGRHKNVWEDPAQAVTPIEMHPRALPAPLSHADREKLFGHFEFRAEPQPGNPEHIRVIGPWIAENLVDVVLPFHAPGMPTHARFHKLIAKQISGFFEALSLAGLLPQIVSFDGSYSPRFKRGRAGGGPEALSNHAWGTAFDVNARFNAFGSLGAPLGAYGSTRRLIPIAFKFGLLCGAQFHAPHCDAGHFEIFELKP